MGNNDSSTAGITAAVSAATTMVGGVPIPNSFDLSQHACLVRIKIRGWSSREKCEAVAQNAATAAGANVEFVEGFINRVAKKHPLRAAVETARNTARNWYKDNLPFWDAGSRLVTNLQYDRVMTELKAMRAVYLQAVEAFLDGLPEMEKTAAANLAGYAGCFPSRSDLERLFSFEIETSAIACADDIRLKHVSAETARDIEASTRRQQAEKVTEVMTRLVVRIQSAMEHFEDQLTSESQGYHGTAVTNMQELAAIIPELNLTGDPGINAVARKLGEMFQNITSKEIKEDPKKQKELLAKTGDILARVKTMKVTDAI